MNSPVVFEKFFQTMVNSINITRRKCVWDDGTVNYEYTFLITLNEDGVYGRILFSRYSDFIVVVIKGHTYMNVYSYNIEKHYGITSPFLDHCMNDAQISPDLKHAVFVGDENALYIACIKYEKLDVVDLGGDEGSDWEMVDDEELVNDDVPSNVETEHTITTATHWNFCNFRRINLFSYPWQAQHAIQQDTLVSMQYMSWNATSKNVPF